MVIIKKIGRSLTKGTNKKRYFAVGLLFSATILASQVAAAEFERQGSPTAQIEMPPPDRSTTALLQKISNPLLLNLDRHLLNVKAITEEFIAKLIPTHKENEVYLYTQSELPTCSFRIKSNCLRPELKDQIEKNPLHSVYLNTLFTPFTLSTEIEQLHMQNAISAVLKSIFPLQAIDFSKLFYRNELPLKISDQPIKEYIASLRAYSASLSFPLSHIVSLYEERKPITLNKAQQEALVELQKEDWFKGYKLNIHNISRATLSKISAERRLLDKKWKAEQEQNPPAALQRETNQLLAEIRASLEEMKVLQEKTVMALSLLLLENANGQRPKIEYEARKITEPDPSKN